VLLVLHDPCAAQAVMTSSGARFSPSLAAWSLAALGVGLGLGTIGQLTGFQPLWSLSAAVAPLGDIWLNALRMTVIPLVITQLLAALVPSDRDHSVAGLGGRAVGLFVLFLVTAGVFTILVSTQILEFYAVPPELVASLRVESIPEAALEAARSKPTGLGEWLTGLVPSNPFEAAVRGDILQMLVFTILVGVAAARLPDAQRAPLAGIIRSLAETMMILVSWVLWGTPFGVFSLILGLSLETGLGALNLFAAYIGILCGLLIFVTALLFPLAAFLGRVPVRTFARAVMPAQIVGAGTQSSLASLPALVKGGQDHLSLPGEVTGFILPLAVSTFKLNQAISPTFRFLLLAHVFGVPLGVGEMGTYLLVVIMLSFGVAGVPRGGGGFRTLPLYIAAGIPIEGVVLLEAVKTIPDVFMTTLNVTADMTVATILTRESRVNGAEPDPTISLPNSPLQGNRALHMRRGRT
jgi:proton glutamate symport protein